MAILIPLLSAVHCSMESLRLSESGSENLSHPLVGSDKGLHVRPIRYISFTPLFNYALMLLYQFMKINMFRYQPMEGLHAYRQTAKTSCLPPPAWLHKIPYVYDMTT